MKRLAVAVALAVMLSAVLSACGGGGGGGGTPGSAGLATGTFTKTAIESGTSSYWGDMFGTTVQSRYMMLYLPANIHGAGYVKSISVKYGNAGTASAVTCPHVTIKMGHTLVSSLTGTFDNNVEQGRGTFETVLNDATVTVPAGAAGDDFKIDLGKNFYYNGVENLVVQVSRAAACSAEIDVNTHGTSPVYTALVYSQASSTATTGATYAELLDTTFTFAGGDDAVELGGASSTATAPFGTTHNRQQMVYLASEINGNGPITGLAFKTGATTVAGSYTYTLKLGHTTLSSLTTGTFDNNFSGSPVTVVSNGTFTIPGGVPADTYVWMPFPGTFTYNGSDNLIVDLDVSSGSVNNPILYTNVAETRLAYGTAGSAIASGTTTLVFDTVFRFNGGTIAAGIGANSYSSQVFDGTPDGAEIQSLYLASELGTGGNITSISLRLRNDSVAASYSNYTVKIGHTSKTQLSGSDTYASNMDENMTVHSGSFSIPAGLKAGDWITVPLSTPFTYNPEKNLAVLFSSSVGASNGNDVRWASSATRYPLRVVGDGAGGAATPSWTDNGILEIRFHMQ